MIDRQPTTIAIWTGRILSTLVVVILLADAAVNLLSPELLKTEMEAVGFPVEFAPVPAALMLLCAAVYAYPRTAVLGAILVIGFFGGAFTVASTGSCTSARPASRSRTCAALRSAASHEAWRRSAARPRRSANSWAMS
jgi:hypothetical protein